MSAEKKKLFIVGLLAFIILCVGVFQFTGGKKPEETAAKPKAKANKSIAATEPTGSADARANAWGHPSAGAGNAVVPGGDKTALAAAVPAEMDLPERDPFDGEKFLPADAQAKPTPAPTPAKVASRIPPVQPIGLGGSLPADGKNINLPSLTAKPPEVFEYTVSGVVTGDRSAAIFQDSKGNQRLIQLGGSLDGDTKVVSIERGKVTVSFHGKNKTLTVGADNPTEKRSDEK